MRGLHNQFDFSHWQKLIQYRTYCIFVYLSYMYSYRIFSIDCRIFIVICDIRYTIYEIFIYRIHNTLLWRRAAMSTKNAQKGSHSMKAKIAQVLKMLLLNRYTVAKIVLRRWNIKIKAISSWLIIFSYIFCKKR